ncbi:MAG: hypothetical protein PHH59_10935 [Methylovulum sp.]|uniref:hypothetical protein n=1 Tax=Methylovulum sp. TaxID=1916980 RepID=UPI00260E3EB5|nr:hypothetical protein [Methylovulum sp.]MDD2724521.1 hypothetical protein [Methylovulum sp.]MDD5124048.1 hypothetical protein [Methylovulum sp.]
MQDYQIENDYDYGFSKELKWLDNIEGNGNIGHIKYKGNLYINPWLSYHLLEDDYGNVIEEIPYADYPEEAKKSECVPHICKIPAFTIEEYHTSKGDAHLSVLLSTDGDIVNYYYLVNKPPIPIKKITLFVSEQDVEKLKNKGVVKKNEITETERQTMLKLIIGMAMDAYGYDPNATRNSASGSKNGISAKLQTKGISINDDTIRKYLCEAKDLIEP